MTEQFEIALAGLIGAVLGGLLSGFYQHVRDLSTKPVLSVDYKDDDAHFVDFDWIKPDGTNWSAVYVRVRIQNLGSRPAKGLRLFLTGLEKVQPSGVTPTSLHDALVLRWPGGLDYAPRDLPRGVDFYADVVCFSKTTPDWQFRVKEMYANHTKLPKYRGTYRFHILATADNADPAECMIDVTYDGNWRNVRAVPARSEFDVPDKIRIEIEV